jgi:delta 1-pyrroline-5-carboxylate dehydrogenase
MSFTVLSGTGRYHRPLAKGVGSQFGGVGLTGVGPFAVAPRLFRRLRNDTT